MLTTSFSRDRHYNMLSSTTMTNRVPPKRCLFGVPNPKETIDLLQEALDLERTRFARRWGIDPREDKENLCVRTERSPRKRTVPYSRQNNLHDNWRLRRPNEINKNCPPPSSNTTGAERNPLQPQQQNVDKSAST